MSSSKKFAGVAAAFLAVIGTIAIVAALAVGLTGWPPTRASAAPRITPGALGIGDRTTGAVTTETPSADKVSVETTTAVAAALVSATPKSLARIPVVKKRTARSSAYRGTVRSSKAGSPKGMRTARVSWYGPGFYGHTMAGGGQLTPTSMVVAHRTMAFGTRVQINYRGRTVIAVVRDRGPFIAGRTFDLGPGTAKALGFSGVGTISYRVL